MLMGDRYRVVGWKCKPIDPAQNDGVPLQYLVRFERDDPIPTSEIFKRPNAEDFDDYREYKRAIREQRDAEKEGAEILNAKRASTDMFITRMKTMRDHDEPQNKAVNYMYTYGSIDVSLTEPTVSASGSEAPDDGLGQLFKRPTTAKSARSTSQSHSNSYDGSVDDASHGIDSRLLEALALERVDDTIAPTHEENLDESLAGDKESTGNHTVTTMATVTQASPPIWSELFGEVNWRAGRTGTRGRKLIDDAKVSGSIEPTATSPFTTAEARGAFEMARARKPLPANAPAFLAALSRVYHDIAMPDYVAKLVVKESDV